MFRKMFVNILCLLFLLIIEFSFLNAEYNLVELNPGFNYSDWYKKETGFTINPQWFGAWVIAPRNDELYFGFGSAIPADNYDGAMLAKWVGDWLIPLGQFDEQGIHCIKWVEDTLYGIGSDPSLADGWDGGNFYKYFPNTGQFLKLRYDINKIPILPNVLHSWGLYFDKDSNCLFLSTSSYNPSQYSKNGGCGNPMDSSNACFGQVWKSQDNGNSWELIAGRNGFEVSKFRTMDINKFNGDLYVHTYYSITENNVTSFIYNLKKSSDYGVSWIEIPDVVPNALFRMFVFKNKLVFAANIARTIYVIDENYNINTLIMPGALNYSFNVFANVDDKYLITYFSDGSVHATNDLENWTELIPSTGRNFLSIAYWEHEKSIVIAERGDIGSIWKLDISDLLNTEVRINSEPEISFKVDNNYVSIHSENYEINSVGVIDVLGNRISIPISSNSNNIKFNISQLTSGLYFVCYRYQKNFFVKKIMKY